MTFNGLALNVFVVFFYFFPLDQRFEPVIDLS